MKCPLRALLIGSSRIADIHAAAMRSTEKPVVLTREEGVRLPETDTTHGRILIRIPRSLRGLRHSAGTEADIERK